MPFFKKRQHAAQAPPANPAAPPPPPLPPPPPPPPPPPAERAPAPTGDTWELPDPWPTAAQVNTFGPRPHPDDPDPLRVRARKTELAAVLGDSAELRTVACLLPEEASADAAVGVWVAGRRVGTATPRATNYDQLCAALAADGFCAAEVRCYRDDDGKPQAELFPELHGPMTRRVVQEVLNSAGFPNRRVDDGYTSVAGISVSWLELDNGGNRLIVTWETVQRRDPPLTDEEHTSNEAERAAKNKECAKALRAAGYEARTRNDGYGWGYVSVLGFTES